MNKNNFSSEDIIEIRSSTEVKKSKNETPHLVPNEKSKKCIESPKNKSKARLNIGSVCVNNANYKDANKGKRKLLNIIYENGLIKKQKRNELEDDVTVPEENSYNKHSTIPEENSYSDQSEENKEDNEIVSEGSSSSKQSNKKEENEETIPEESSSSKYLNKNKEDEEETDSKGNFSSNQDDEKDDILEGIVN
nr:MAG: hypothetical protein [Porcellio scaber clopovirus]